MSMQEVKKYIYIKKINKPTARINSYFDGTLSVRYRRCARYCPLFAIKRGRRDEKIIIGIMSSKLLIVFSALLVAAQAAQPRIGFNVPNFSLGRIVGGVEATRGEFPHQVTLQWGMPPLASHQHFCGGTIIDSQWILTAGHCVLAVPAYGSFVIKAGKHEIKPVETTEQVVPVVSSYVHEKYVGNVAPYDIALLKLKTPLKMTGNVSKISLPKAGAKPTGDTVLSGWGSISASGGNMPCSLRKAILPIVDFDTCKRSMEAIVGPSPLHETNVCTGPLTGGLSACSGDSGGPLILKNADGVSEVVGVVSWGVMPCGTKGAPSVFTGVASFIDWIELTMKNN